MAAVPVQVPEEYVRQQLQLMGIKDLSKEDLDAYTKDFSKLIQEHLQEAEVSSSTITDSSLSDTSHASINGGASSQAVSSQLHMQYRPPPLGVQQTPINTHHLQPPGSAVFKTFPGDKENRVEYLSPSLSPSPNKGSILQTPASEDSVLSGSSSQSSRRAVPDRGGVSASRRSQSAPVKRKVMRKCNGQSRVFDESVSDFGSDAGSPSGQLASQLSDLSITSMSSSVTDTTLTSDTSAHSLQELPGTRATRPPAQRQQCCQSFIRPLTSHPHTRGLKKCDPVNRYHQFRELWDAYKTPGEKSRNPLRWHIRERLLHQDVPFYETNIIIARVIVAKQKPQRHVHKPVEYVVPTSKKRSALRWEVRHALAHQ